jgi:protein subunit release factor A
MGINDVNLLNKVYTQSDIDKAMHEGYKLAEKQYSENIKNLKEEIKQLKVLLPTQTTKDNNKIIED